jgi:hypothetical protein
MRVRVLGELQVEVAGTPVDLGRQLLGPWREQPVLPRDYMWTTTTTIRSWAWTALGDRQAVAELRRQLTPYADRLVCGGGAVTFLGSQHHWLGLLAAAEGDGVDRARHHLTKAVEVHRRLGLAYWEGRSRRELEALG